MTFFQQRFLRQPLSLWFSIAVLVLIGAAVWYYGAPRQIPPPADGRSAVIDASANRLRLQSGSDEIEAIQADLKATDLSDLDGEFGKIDAELGR